MPYIRVWIHFVWSTKNREPYLSDELRPKIIQHIRTNAREKGIFIDSLNGFTDHLHCLISLGSDQSMDKIMQLIKGESSFWINKNKLTNFEFAWQDEYFAASVSEANIDGVRKYISNQEQHHCHRSFEDEFEDFLTRAGFQKFKDGRKS